MEIYEKLLAAGVKSVDVIYTNELDCGSYVSDTLRADSTTNRYGSSGRNLPHDASW